MTRVVWADPDPHWDEGIVLDLTPEPAFTHYREAIPDTDEGAVVVIAGQHCLQVANTVASFVASLPWSLVIITGDEEALFPVEILARDEMHLIFTQYHDRGMDKVIPIGCPPGTTEWLRRDKVLPERERDIDVMFAGQDTHERRHELLATMKAMACEPGNGNIAWHATTGFREGLSQTEYLEALTRTRIAPCPSGPHSLDSFRLYEALEAGALPVVEYRTPHGDEREFWRALFGNSLIPEVWSWDELPQLIAYWNEGGGPPVNAVREFWRSYKTRLHADFAATIRRLSTGPE